MPAATFDARSDDASLPQADSGIDVTDDAQVDAVHDWQAEDVAASDISVADVSADTAPEAAPDVPVDSSCPAGWSWCGGQCVALDTPQNCGACGNGCIPVGGSACLNGACKLTACSGSMGDCDGDVSNGCETDLTKTLSHCGFCYSACSLPNATPDCLDATCRVKTCNTGYGNCDGAHPNGCEIHLTESTSHCGACDAPCSTANNSSRTCEDGKCDYVCLDNFANCNGSQPGDSDDGCETPIDSSVANCGGCGLACTNAHGTTSCAGKLCVPQCANGFGDCNANRLRRLRDLRIRQREPLRRLQPTVRQRPRHHLLPGRRVQTPLRPELGRLRR